MHEKYFKDIFKKPYSKETMLKCKRYFDQFKKDNIENFQVIDKNRILIIIKNNNQLIGLIYDIDNKKVIQKLTK